MNETDRTSDPDRDRYFPSYRYKRMALKYHPDKNASPQAEDIFVRLTHAFQLLQSQ